MKDMYDRDIQVGDIIAILSGKVHQFQVIAIQEPSALNARPGQPSFGKMTLSIAFDQPIMYQTGAPNVKVSDIVITQKFTELEVPEGTAKQ